jgi:hypothetical protein
MFLAGSSDRWTWSMDVERSIDFCIHALRRDGLHVAPFDQHPEGDGSLRRNGLEAESWRTWLTTVLDAHGRLKALSRADDPSQVDHRAVFELAESIFSPAALCPGSSELRARLEALWVEYEPAGQRWEQAFSIGESSLLGRQVADGGARIWKGLLPYHERLTTLQVYLVDYPAPAVLTVPPLTCVIAPATGDRDGFAGQVISAAEMLAPS